MKHGLKFAMIAAMLATTSACARPEPPRTVSDFCIVDQRLSGEPAPGAGVDDPGNRFDTDETFAQVLEHNAAYDRLCPAVANRKVGS